MAPGSAYAVEVTSISAACRTVMVARADHSMATSHSRATPASTRPVDAARSTGSVTRPAACGGPSGADELPPVTTVPWSSLIRLSRSSIQSQRTRGDAATGRPVAPPASALNDRS
jgi:hypothetical protein